MKKWIILALIMSNSFLAFSQEKITNTLLWRISGKHLTRPSYLFGTMHLTDKRVFQLGDSLYKAIEQTEGFAAELDMNRLGMQMINLMMKQEEQKNATEPPLIKDVVSPDTWNRYKDALAKKLEKKAEKITVADLEEIESRLEADIFRKGDMPTFLDAWLSGQARKQGKWVGGIEDLEDQLEHIDNIEGKIQKALFDDEYYRSGIEWLLKLYTAQRLDSIDAMMYREADGGKDYIMIKRNLKMARRMDSLSTFRSMLFAVGAAHLPGDSGVISLLRSRGFTVTPVFSSKKISADKYISKGTDAAWFPVTIEDSAYNLQMPGIAESFEAFKSLGLDMKIFFDISFMKMYMTFSMEIPADRKKLGYDSLYKGLSERFAKGRSIKEKTINVNGIEGREYRLSMEDGQMKMQIFIPRLERVVMNIVFAFQEKSINDNETDKFFKTFTMNASRPKVPVAEKKWTRLEYPALSFSFEMPLKPKETKDVVSDEGMVSYSWQAVDIKEQVFYGMNVSTMKEGMHDPTSDSSYFESLKTLLQTSFENPRILDSAYITVSGYPAFQLTVAGKTEGEQMVTKIISVARGGIGYYMFCVFIEGSASEATADKYLGSFRLLPYTHPVWKTINSPDGSFSSTGPFALIKKEREEDDESHPGAERFLLFDTIAYVTTYVDRTLLPSWLWFRSDTGFLRSRSQIYSSWTDSIEGYQVKQKGEMVIADFIVTKQGDNLVKKVKLILDGDKLYELFGYFAKQDLPGMYNRFYDDFTISQPSKKVNRLDSRVKKLTETLKKADKETAELLKAWWPELPLSTADIPLLQESLLQLYPDFDTTYYANLNKKIFDAIEAHDTTHTTVQFIKNNYATIKKENELVKPFALGYLSNVQTAEAFEVLKECLMKHPVQTEENLPAFSHSLYDSLELTAKLFPEIMQLAGTEPLWDVVSSYTRMLMDSNLLSNEKVKEYGKYFQETARRKLDKDKEKIEEAGYGYEDLIRLLGIIGGTESQNLLKQFAKFDHRHVKFHTLIAMLENNMVADSKTIYTIATTDDYRHELYDELERLGKLKLFPGSYLSQKSLGQSKLYEYATDEETPEVITPVGERTFLYKGKEQKFFLYKVRHSEEESYTYLGIAGPYPMDRRVMKSTHDATGLHWDEEYDPKRIDEQFKAYMKMLEEMEKEDE